MKKALIILFSLLGASIVFYLSQVVNLQVPSINGIQQGLESGLNATDIKIQDGEELIVEMTMKELFQGEDIELTSSLVALTVLENYQPQVLDLKKNLRLILNLGESQIVKTYKFKDVLKIRKITQKTFDLFASVQEKASSNPIVMEFLNSDCYSEAPIAQYESFMINGAKKVTLINGDSSFSSGYMAQATWSNEKTEALRLNFIFKQNALHEINCTRVRL